MHAVQSYGQLLADKKGNGVLIIGESSSGKSTLTRLMVESYRWKFIGDDSIILSIESDRLMGVANLERGSEDIFLRIENNQFLFITIPEHLKFHSPVVIRAIVLMKVTNLIDRVEILRDKIKVDDLGLVLGSWPQEERPEVLRALRELQHVQIIRPSDKSTLSEMPDILKQISQPISCAAIFQ